MILLFSPVKVYSVLPKKQQSRTSTSTQLRKQIYIQGTINTKVKSHCVSKTAEWLVT